MKMVCKKLLSLVLVALMLVTALPFQASAAELKDVWVQIKEEDASGNSTDAASWNTQYDSDTTTLQGLLNEGKSNYTASTEFMRASVKKTDGKTYSIGLEDQIPVDTKGIYVVYAAPKASEPVEPADINWVVKHNGEVKDSGSFTPAGETSKISDILARKVPSNLQVGQLDKIWSQSAGSTVTTDSLVPAGDTVTFSYTIKEETTVDPIKVVVKVNNSDNVVFESEKVPANGEYATVQDLLTYVWNSDWDNAYTYHHAWSHDQQKNLAKDAKVYAGDTLYIALERKSTDGGSGSGSDGGSSKFPYSVYLHIFESGNLKTPLKTVTLDTWTCVKDGVVTLDELKEVIKTYYTAKTSDGIGYDGIYCTTNTTQTDYVNNKNRVDRIDNLDELRSEGYVHLNVWIDNAKAKTDSSSSSSNPKTGDTIYMAVTVMGLSAASLAAVYYISKKRAVR